jgi:hypothetical protein
VVLARGDPCGAARRRRHPASRHDVHRAPPDRRLGGDPA